MLLDALFGNTTPTMRELRLTKLRAIWFGRKSSSVAMRRTRRRTSSLMRGLLCSARLTVDGETCAARATSLIVVFMEPKYPSTAERQWRPNRSQQCKRLYYHTIHSLSLSSKACAPAKVCPRFSTNGYFAPIVQVFTLSSKKRYNLFIKDATIFHLQSS